MGEGVSYKIKRKKKGKKREDTGRKGFKVTISLSWGAAVLYL